MGTDYAVPETAQFHHYLLDIKSTKLLHTVQSCTTPVTLT